MAVKFSKLQLGDALNVLSTAGIALPDPKGDETAYLQAVIDGLRGLIDSTSTGQNHGGHLCDQRGFEARLAREMDRIARSGDVSLLLMLQLRGHDDDSWGATPERRVLQQGFAEALVSGLQDEDVIGIREDGRWAVLLSRCIPEEAESAAQRLCKRLEEAAGPLFAGAGMAPREVSFVCGGVFASQWSDLSHETLTERALGQLALAAAIEDGCAICIEAPPVCEVSAEEKALLFSLTATDDINMGDSLDSSGQ